MRQGKAGKLILFPNGPLSVSRVPPPPNSASQSSLLSFGKFGSDCQLSTLMIVLTSFPLGNRGRLNKINQRPPKQRKEQRQSTFDVGQCSRNTTDAGLPQPLCPLANPAATAHYTSRRAQKGSRPGNANILRRKKYGPSKIG